MKKERKRGDTSYQVLRLASKSSYKGRGVSTATTDEGHKEIRDRAQLCKPNIQ